MKVISLFCSCLVVGGLLSNCNAPAESNLNSELRTTKVEPPIAATLVGTPKPSSDLAELCKQLDEIRKFPGRDPSEKQDPIFEAIVARGKDMMPCLIEQVTDETPMHDPRSAPVWQHYKVGDTAVFLLVHISKNDKLLELMLPPAYREEWKTNGVYAYFNYVSETENRRELQTWWRAWLTKHR